MVYIRAIGRRATSGHGGSAAAAIGPHAIGMRLPEQSSRTALTTSHEGRHGRIEHFVVKKNIESGVAWCRFVVASLSLRCRFVPSEQNVGALFFLSQNLVSEIWHTVCLEMPCSLPDAPSPSRFGAAGHDAVTTHMMLPSCIKNRPRWSDWINSLQCACGRFESAPHT